MRTLDETAMIEPDPDRRFARDVEYRVIILRSDHRRGCPGLAG